MIRFSKIRCCCSTSSSPRKQAAVSVSGMKPCWIPHWRMPLSALTGRSSILPRRKGRTARLYAHLQPRFCGRQWTLSVKPAAGRVIRPHELLFPSDPPIPPTNPPSRHRAPGRGIFDPSAEFFMFPLDNPVVLVYYCRSTSELIGGAARTSRCDCSDPSAAQAKEDAYGMGYPQ